MSRLRIAYIINSVEGGGAASPVPAITQVLRDGGAEVALFALARRDGRALAAMEASGLDVSVRDGGRRDHLQALRWLDRQLAAWRPTHLWTSLARATLLGQIIGQRRRLPVVSWQHNSLPTFGNRELLRWRQRQSMLWVADSESTRQVTEREIGVPPERLILWPIFRADPEARQATPWQPGETLRIGSLGRLHTVKGYTVLAEALGLLAARGIHCEVTIGGDGELRDSLAAVPGIRLAGFTDRPRDFLADLHVYLQPSLSEGFCIAAHEAMQAGLPVIASAVGEMRFSILPGETGWLVPPNDAEALARAIGDAVSHPERLAAMGAKARARVLDRFSAERFQATGEEILRRLR